MVVLHARWEDGAAAVWGELPGSGSSLRVASHDDLIAALPVLSDAQRSWSGTVAPVEGGVPQPSPWAGVDPAAPREPAGDRVPSLRCLPDQVLDLPAALEGIDDRTGVADSLRWLTVAASVAVDLCAAGRFAPSVVHEGDVACSRWVGAPCPGDGRVDDLDACVPAALGSRASAVVDALVDALAREAIAGSRLKSPRRGDVTAGWLAGLRGSDAGFSADPGAIVRLAEALERWAMPEVTTGALQTCLRLVPPTLQADDDGAEDVAGGAVADGASNTWRIEFHLRARDDPSLLVAAADVWAEEGTLAWFDKAYEAPQDRLLADLGRAARLWPPLRAALDVALPVALDLDAAGALDFLADAVPLLEGAGLDVQIPASFGPAATLGVRLRARPEAAGVGTVEGGVGSGLLGAQGICEYDWVLAIGDDVLDEAELVRLAELKQPLVRHRGRWVQVDVGAVDAALKFLAAERDGTGGERANLGGTDLLRVVAGLDAPDIDLPVLGIEAEGWVAGLLDGTLTASAGSRPTPTGFHGQLRPYQERGLGWLRFMSDVGLGAVLADDMGLGKTAQVLALLADEQADGDRRGPTLLVCPTSVLGNWQREAVRFVPGLDVVAHYGSDRARGADLVAAVEDAALVLTTYGVLARDAPALAECRFDRVVLDEAQLVKNARSGASRAARAIPARHHVALTGTPVENRLADLWSIMEFANPGLLGSAAGFRRTFAVPIERYRDDDAATLLGRLTRPFVLRRVKTDPAIAPDLPDKTEVVEQCTLTREQATLYQAVVDDMLAAVAGTDGVRRRGLVLATIGKLKAVCNHPAQLLGDGSPLEGRSGKLARLEELLEAVLATGEKALVFTQFAEFGGRLARHLSDTFGIDVAYLHGGVNQRSRDAMVASFQGTAGAPVMLLSLRAGGVGLNLTAASHVVHFDRWWNPAVEDQATDRAYRIGALRDVMVRKLVCQGTIEERVDSVLEAKRSLADAVIGGGEDWLTSLDVDELRDLVALARDAVAPEGD